MYGRLAQRDSHQPNFPLPTEVEAKYFESRGQFVYQLALSYHFGLALT
jgi:hypothetical protein